MSGSSSQRVDQTKVNQLLNAEDPPDTINRGVSFEFLSRLLKKQKLFGLTTRQVVTQYVIPQTSSSTCSLSGLLRVLHPQSVGRATYYVIHSWDANFERLVQTLGAIDQSHDDFEGNPPFFWLDVFAMRQQQPNRHQTTVARVRENLWLERDNLFSELKLALRNVEKICVVVDPVRSPLVLTRSWCLFECAQALSLRRNLLLFAVPEPPDCPDSFSPLHSFDSSKYSTVQFETSHCSEPMDKEWLSLEIQSLSPQGPVYCNELIKTCFLDWLSHHLIVRVLFPGFLTSCKEIPVLHQTSLLVQTNRPMEAKEMLKRALSFFTQSDCNDFVFLCQMEHDYACLCAKYFQELKPADALLRQVLKRREELLGISHADTIRTMEALALVLKERRKLTESISLFRQVLEWKHKNVGSEQLDTLHTLNSLALTLQKKERYSEAEEVFTDLVQRGEHALGSNNVHVLLWNNNLSVLFQDQGNLSRAEDLLRKTLRRSETALGANHAQTLILVFNLGFCLWQQGRRRLAEALFRRELSACEVNKGVDHKDTVKSRQNLEKLLQEMGETLVITAAEDTPSTATSSVPPLYRKATAAGKEEEDGRVYSSDESLVQAYEDAMNEEVSFPSSSSEEFFYDDEDLEADDF